MKILIVSYSDSVGGAGRAAYRLHRALVSAGHESRMRVRLKKTDDPTVIGDLDGTTKALTAMRWRLGYALSSLQHSAVPGLNSANWLPSSWSDEINASDADVVNLHWVCGETMSIADIGRIRKPVAWTLHDMWPFCGTEHYTSDDDTARWIIGYHRSNRSPADKGWDISRWTAKRKAKAWTRPMHIISPSQWLGDCARKSELFRGWPVHVIPNPLDTETFRPLDRAFSRNVLLLPPDKKIILFGAIGGASEPRKGYRHMSQALRILAGRVNTENYVCVVFGQSRPIDGGDLPFESIWTGHVSDDTTLALLYSAADVMVVPSEQENLPQTATEAQACGCPVVGFRTTGMSDVVQHESTGYLADPFDANDLCAGLQSVIDIDENHRTLMRFNSRRFSVENWSKESTTNKYLATFSHICN